MPGLTMTVEGRTVLVRTGSGDIEYEDQVYRGFRWDGTPVVIERGEHDAARVIPVETPPGYVDVDALEDDLRAVEFVTVSGSILGGDEILCEAGEIERVTEPLTDLVVLRFTLRESLQEVEA